MLPTNLPPAPGPDPRSSSAPAPVREAMAAEPVAAREVESQLGADTGPAAVLDPQEDEGLTAEESAALAELRRLDRAVRAREQRRIAVAGGASALPKYSTERGPDGRGYATEAEPHLDTRGGSSPEQTLIRARRLRAAAHAGGHSKAGQKLAATAAELEREALRALREERLADLEADSESPPGPMEVERDASGR